jgi:DNA-directed RNA polymerase subunit beta'
LAYHEARKRAAIAALTPSAPSAQAAAAEALFTSVESDSSEINNADETTKAQAEVTIVETPAE